MNKVLVGLLVGAALGAVDGLTAWFTPQVRPQILEIVFFSTIKGVIAGVLAGWFARRVESVPKGIAFGFAVGLLLAFAVAAMPDPKTGEHYWWQIMVPGSLLGGVIGWSTQRYGRPGGRSARGAVATAAMVAILLAGANVQADDGHDHAAPKANAAFERLKSMAGTWKANAMTPDGDPSTVEYRVTASGSVVMETMFAGSEHEMINMYTVDGDTVTATHYCAGNQPFLRMNAQKSTGTSLVFDFVKVAGATPNGYINGVTITFGDDGKVIEEWSSSTEGPHMKLYLQGRK